MFESFAQLPNSGRFADLTCTSDEQGLVVRRLMPKFQLIVDISLIIGHNSRNSFSWIFLDFLQDF